MEFLNIQIIIFFSVILFSALLGKKGTLTAILIWLIQTITIYKELPYWYLQIIILGISFQIGLLIGVSRDFIIKKINLRKKTQ